jgi:transposase
MSRRKKKKPKQRQCSHKFELLTQDRQFKVCKRCGVKRRFSEMNGDPLEPRTRGEPEWVTESKAKGNVFLRELQILIALLE